jgi:tetratricopeptide (TPR) repeat protein
MRLKLLQLALVLGCLCSLAVPGLPQEIPQDIRRREGDPNNAGIEGRILLPSGQSADFNIKVILSDVKRPLITLHTNKHAEFRFPDLSEGEYYVQVIADENLYEPSTQTVRLARSQLSYLTFTLRKKALVTTRTSNAAMVSTSELSERVPVAARKEFSQGVKLAGKGDTSGAIEHLQRAVAIYPDYVAAINNLGVQYLKLKEFDEAAAQFHLALEKEPRYFNSIINLTLVMLERQDYMGAIARLNEAIAVDSSRAPAYLLLGISLLNVGELIGAERALSRALLTGGADCVVAHYCLAQLYLKSGRDDEASRSLRAYLEEAPKGEFAKEAKSLLNRLTSH